MQIFLYSIGILFNIFVLKFLVTKNNKMAFRKEIFQKLREKHKNTPKAILEKIADHLEKGVTEETEIETTVDDAEGLITGFATLYQSEGDRRAAEALKGARTEKGGKGEEDPDNPETGKDDKETPAWAKALIDSNNSLKAELEALKQGKTIDTRKQSLLEKLKGVDDEKFTSKTLKNFARMKFETDEEFEDYLEEIETEVADYQQNLSNEELGSQKPPIKGIQTGKAATEAELDVALTNFKI